MDGLVFDIQRFSTHDGPGIRTVVFLKGCPLSCPWCENPESQAFSPEIIQDSSRCVGCGSCLAPQYRGIARKADDGTIAIDRNAAVPDTFQNVCPSLALRVAGLRRTVDQVMAEVRKDRAFYEKSGGGLTISGGEPLAQAEFASALAEAAIAEGIGIAVETCLAASRDAVSRMARLPALWLADLKHGDAARFREAAGGELPHILENMRYLASSGAEIVLRIPVVPGFNDDDKSIEAILRAAESLKPRARRADLLPYHELAAGKYKALGRPYPMAPGLRVPPERLTAFAARARARGFKISVGG